MNRAVRSRIVKARKRVKDKTLRIGVPIEYNIAELSSTVRQVWSQFLKSCRRLGCTIVPISLPTTKHALSAYYVLAPAEASSNLAKYDGVRYGTRADGPDGADSVLFSRTRGEGFGDEVKRRILLGSYTLSAEAIDNYFIRAQKVRRLVQQDFNRVFRLQNPLDKDHNMQRNEEGVDFIICPTAPTLAPSLEDVGKRSSVESYMNDVFTVPASLAGLPALSVPRKVSTEAENGNVESGHVGIQIIGQYGDDVRVMYLAQSLEKQQKADLRAEAQSRIRS
jgi:aspartyl-tRNA(Asn)/glutamyl-tRNA(Gln) amidotransferase subunit A